MMPFDMDSLITQLINSKRVATPIELARIINHAAGAPFATDLLETDQALWGSFWHFDVISPGYRLPAVELALLRATRLDNHWPQDTTVEQYLADLRQVIQHSQAQIWSLTAAAQPCIIFAAPIRVAASAESDISNSLHKNLLAIVWYCASTGKLHAGYKTSVERLYFEEAIKQRGAKMVSQTKPPTINTQNWLALAVKQVESQIGFDEDRNLAVRLDAAILRQRLSQ